jgi:hypothetical protein
VGRYSFQLIGNRTLHDEPMLLAAMDAEVP